MNHHAIGLCTDYSLCCEVILQSTGTCCIGCFPSCSCVRPDNTYTIDTALRMYIEIYSNGWIMFVSANIHTYTNIIIFTMSNLLDLLHYQKLQSILYPGSLILSIPIIVQENLMYDCMYIHLCTQTLIVCKEIIFLVYACMFLSKTDRNIYS